MHLSGFLTQDKLNLIEEAERRLVAPGGVSTTPVPPSSEKKKRTQGNRPTKQSRYNKYFFS